MSQQNTSDFSHFLNSKPISKWNPSKKKNLLKTQKLKYHQLIFKLGLNYHQLYILYLYQSPTLPLAFIMDTESWGYFFHLFFLSVLNLLNEKTDMQLMLTYVINFWTTWIINVHPTHTQWCRTYNKTTCFKFYNDDK